MAKQLFIEGDDPNSRACFGWQTIDEGFYGIKEGYFNSAVALVDIALKEGRKGRVDILDQYVFPIVFSFRHSIEASIKHIYYRAKNHLASGGHNLINLWDNLYNDVMNSPDFPSLMSSLNSINFQEIRSLIEEFSNIDQGSDVFRYLINKNSVQYFTQHKFIDYANMKETMNYLYSNLDTIYYSIDEFLSE